MSVCVFCVRMCYSCLFHSEHALMQFGTMLCLSDAWSCAVRFGPSSTSFAIEMHTHIFGSHNYDILWQEHHNVSASHTHVRARTHRTGRRRVEIYRTTRVLASRPAPTTHNACDVKMRIASSNNSIMVHILLMNAIASSIPHVIWTSQNASSEALGICLLVLMCVASSRSV